MKNIAVVGNGIAGLCAAIYALDKGASVTLIGNGPLGGLSSGVPFAGVDSVWLERFYHHFFLTDLELINLYHKMGLADSILWKNSSVGVYTGGRLWPFTTVSDLLRFRPMGSLLQRFLFGFSAFQLSRIKNWRSLDDITVEEYCRKMGVSSGYRAIWTPLLKAKFDKQAHEISAAFLWGRIHARFGSRRKGREVLGYPRGGFQPFFDRLAAAVGRHSKGTLRLGEKVLKVYPGANPRLQTERGMETFDHIIMAAGLRNLGSLVEGLPASHPQPEQGGYMGIVCQVLVSKRSITPYYWLNICDEGFPFGGIVEQTNMIDPAVYGNVRVAYIFNYVPPGHPYLTLAPGDILAQTLPALRRINPDFSEQDVISHNVYKENFATPVYGTNYQERVVDKIKSLPGVEFALMSQVYPYDRNMNHGAILAKEAVERVLPSNNRS